MGHSVPIQAGYDYAKAILELRRIMGYDEIAARCGFAGASSVSAILKGTIPSHPRGEALYILYVEAIGRKPS